MSESLRDSGPIEPQETVASHAPPNQPQSCCAPSGSTHAQSARITPTSEQLKNPHEAGSPPHTRHRVEQCEIPAGSFAMGDSSGDGLQADGERPVHEVTLDGFSIDATAVTNAQFARFVADTGYTTSAERLGASAVFHLLVDAPTADITGPISGTPWWIGVRGASWRRPGGRASSLHGLEDHPVVHVSWHDATAYCAWAGRRLPSEAEWERASRGGLDGGCFPWGDAPIDGSDGTWRANVWQGTFPAHNTASDGWIGTAPVRSYAPNDFGLWQTVGNVWEWCADGFDATAYMTHATHDPRGPETAPERVLRGGSYLCHPSYCNRYRNSARSRNTPDSSMGNAGFRTVSRNPVEAGGPG